MKTKTKPAAVIEVDYQKKCGGCGQPGATQNGYCLACVAANMGKPLSLRAEQPSLPNAEPELDALGLAAKRFQRMVADLAELKDEKAIAEQELIEKLRASGRRNIKVGTLVFTLTHKDAVDKITVKKGKI
jgi:hypothetical protein